YRKPNLFFVFGPCRTSPSAQSDGPNPGYDFVGVSERGIHFACFKLHGGSPRSTLVDLSEAKRPCVTELIPRGRSISDASPYRRGTERPREAGRLLSVSAR